MTASLVTPLMTTPGLVISGLPEGVRVTPGGALVFVASGKPVEIAMPNPLSGLSPPHCLLKGSACDQQADLGGDTPRRGIFASQFKRGNDVLLLPCATSPKISKHQANPRQKEDNRLAGRRLWPDYD